MHQNRDVLLIMDHRLLGIYEDQPLACDRLFAFMAVEDGIDIESWIDILRTPRGAHVQLHINFRLAMIVQIQRRSRMRVWSIERYGQTHTKIMYCLAV